MKEFLKKWLTRKWVAWLVWVALIVVNYITKYDLPDALLHGFTIVTGAAVGVEGIADAVSRSKTRVEG